MGPAERSDSGICQLVPRGGGERLNKALRLLFEIVRTFVLRRGAAFRHQVLSACSSTISFHSFKYQVFFHLFSYHFLSYFYFPPCPLLPPLCFLIHSCFFLHFRFIPTLSFIFCYFLTLFFLKDTKD